MKNYAAAVFVCFVVLCWFHLTVVSIVVDDVWMTYDDLKSTAICQYKSPFPTIDPAEVHIVMWRSRSLRSRKHSVSIPAVCTAAVSMPTMCSISVPLTTTVASSVLPVPSVLPLPAAVIPVIPAAANDQLLRACGMFASQWTKPPTVNGNNRFTCSVLSLPPVTTGSVQPAPKVLYKVCY